MKKEKQFEISDKLVDNLLTEIENDLETASKILSKSYNEIRRRIKLEKAE